MFIRLKRFFKVIYAVIISLLAIPAASTLAWLIVPQNEINVDVNEGYFVSQYFDSGSGTIDDPFVITRPVHYFHLVGLYQRNNVGEQSFAASKYYFQVGKKFADAPDPDAYYVYDYNDDGTLKGSDPAVDLYSKSLNLAYYQGSQAMVPLGTSQTPFTGHIDGNNLEIRNLHIKAYDPYTIGGTTRIVNSSDIGIFGYIDGTYENGVYDGGSAKNLFYKDVIIDLTGLDSSIGALTGFSHEDHDNNNIYVGYIAGHCPVIKFENSTADVTGIIENIYVNNCEIIGYNGNSFAGNPVSDFGLLGHIDVLTEGAIPIITSAIDDIQEQSPDIEYIDDGGGTTGFDEGSGWGGSIDMFAVFTKLSEIRADAYSSGSQVETNKYLYLDMQDTFGGSYYFAKGTGFSQIIFLSGIAGHDTYELHYTEGYSIKKDTNYLGVNSTSLKPINCQDAEAGAGFEWNKIDDSGSALVTLINGVLYNLVADESGQLSFSTTKTTKWQTEENYIYTEINGTNYYLTYHNNNWCVVKVGNVYNISYNGNYLTVNDEIRPSYSTTNKAEFNYVSGYYYTKVNGTNYYLAVDNDLNLVYTVSSSSAAIWHTSDDGIYTSKNGITYYLCLNNGVWVLGKTGTFTRIKDGNNYMVATNNNLSSTTTSENATDFIVDSNKIMFEYNGQTYYLTCNMADDTSTTVSVSSTAGQTNWQFEMSLDQGIYATNAYIVRNDSYYYLHYDSGWKLLKIGDFYKIADGSNYLNISNNNLIGSTTGHELLLDNSNRFYLIENGTKYYLTANYQTCEVILTTTASQGISWTLHNDNLKYGNQYDNMSVIHNNLEYHLCYENSKWMLKHFGDFKTIHDGNGNYLSYDSQSGLLTSSNESGASKFIEKEYDDSSSYYYLIINDSIKYLNCDITGIKLSDNPCAWYYQDNHYFTYKESTPYYLVYQTSKWQILVPGSYTILSSNNNFIGVNGTNLTVETSDASAALFSVTVNNEFYVNVDGTNYYLTYDSDLKLKLSDTSKTSFSYGSIESQYYTLLYVEINEIKYSLLYDDCWCLSKHGVFYTIYDNNYYMKISNTSVGETSSASEATEWIFSNNYIYSYVNNTKYYLSRSSTTGQPTLSVTTPEQKWYQDGSYLYVTYNNDNYYLTYDSGWKLYILGTMSFFKVDDNYLKINFQTNTIENSKTDYTYFIYNNGWYAVSADKKLYLNVNTSNYSLTLGNSSTTTWSYTNNVATYTTATGDEYYITCENEKWILKQKEEYITIKDGSNYLEANGSSLQTKTSASTKWHYDETNNYIYTSDSATKYYLTLNNYELTLTSTTSNLPKWTIENTTGDIKTTIAGFDFYIHYDDTWKVVYVGTTYTIKEGENYLNVDSTNLTAGSSSNTFWIYQNNKVITIINGSKYYLKLNGTNLTLDSSSGSDFVLSGSDLYTLINTLQYHAKYENSTWIVARTGNFYKIYVGSNYLCSDGSTISTSNSANATLWNKDGNKYFVYSGSTPKYLNVSGQDVVISNSGIDFIQDGSTFYTTISSTKMYLNYKNKFIVEPEKPYIIINSDSNYLCYSGAANVTNGTSQANATKWYIDGDKLYALDGDNKYYLTGTASSTTLSVTSDSSKAAIVSYSGSSSEIELNVGTNTWKVRFDTSNNTWTAVESLFFYIYYKTGSSYYDPTYNASYVFQAPTKTSNKHSANAIKWSYTGKYDGNGPLKYDSKKDFYKSAITAADFNNAFDQGYGGYLSMIGADGATRYLKADNYTSGISTNFSLTTNLNDATKFVYGCFNGTTYYLVCYFGNINSGFNYKNFYTMQFYSSYGIILRRTTGNNITFEMQGQPATTCGIASGKTIPSASLTTVPIVANITNSLKTNAKPGIVVSNIKIDPIAARNYFERSKSSKYQFKQFTYDNLNKIYPRTIEAPTSLVYVTLVTTNIPGEMQIYKNVVSKPSQISIFTYIYDKIINVVDVITITKEQVYVNSPERMATSEIDTDLTTYFPLIRKTGNYKKDINLEDYEASYLNTGYIISGSYQTESDSDFGADIRISYYGYNDAGTPSRNAVNNIGTFTEASDSKMEIITVKDGTFYRITDYKHNTTHSDIPYGLKQKNYEARTVSELGLNGYENPSSEIRLAREGLEDMFLADPSRVYGLHFMNATISMDHIVNVEGVRLLDKDYETYEFPEDSIDFISPSKGTINFFAGTFYPNNNTFFSVHEIFRDAAGKITDIKELSKIYYNETISENYAYQYVGESIPNRYSEQDLVYDLSWVTDPSSIDDLVRSAIYYYEIPCNKGEYALGSVAGKTGAYLLYLDIASHGAGDAQVTPGQGEGGEEDDDGHENRKPASVISQNPIIQNVGFRDVTQEIELDASGNHRVLFDMTYDIPQNATQENFSIKVEYEKAINREDYEQISDWCTGVYKIYIKNLTSDYFALNVLLVDDNDNLEDNYPYAYEIYLWNGTEYYAIINNELQYSSGYKGTLRKWSNTYNVYESYVQIKK